MHTNDSTTHLPDDSVHDQLDCDLMNMMRLTSDKKLLLEVEDEKVSDDDFYVDDFESDNDGDGDANDEQWYLHIHVRLDGIDRFGFYMK